MKKKRTPEENFKYNLKARYGITVEQYNYYLQRQNNRCAICGKYQKDEQRRFAIDHNHQTGMVRGLLCNYCNSKLMKYLRDNKRRAMGLIAYLTSALEQDENWT